MSVDEIHNFSNLSLRGSFKVVFSLDFCEPVLYVERTHGESTLPLLFRKYPTDAEKIDLSLG